MQGAAARTIRTLEQCRPADHIPPMAIQIRTSLEEPDTGETFVPHRPARPEKSQGGIPFRVVSDYEPSGDQPTAIAELTEHALAG